MLAELIKDLTPGVALSLPGSISLFCRTLADTSDSHREQVWKVHTEMRVNSLKVSEALAGCEELCFDICQMLTNTIPINLTCGDRRR